MKFLFVLGAAVAVGSSAIATTKGLNQIVTPDIQPMGALSVSFQAVNQVAGNPYEIQYELGLTKNFEGAIFQGIDPGEAFFAAEYGVIQTPNWLLSAGFSNWSTRGDEPAPFVEGGYVKGAMRLTAGLQRYGRANDVVLGAAYQATPTIQLMTDYIGGAANFATFGFTYSPNSALNINPAIYVSNDTHKLYPYLVVSWTIQAFKGSKSG